MLIQRNIGEHRLREKNRKHTVWYSNGRTIQILHSWHAWVSAQRKCIVALKKFPYPVSVWPETEFSPPKFDFQQTETRLRKRFQLREQFPSSFLRAEIIGSQEWHLIESKFIPSSRRHRREWRIWTCQCIIDIGARAVRLIRFAEFPKV